jgi:TetR/AcrR family transcriptional regulator
MPSPPTPRRGRPPQSAAAIEATRARILDATRVVFSEVGYHGLSVELVIAEAGLSRPTFYKYFRSTEEPIELVIVGVNDALIERLLREGDFSRDPVAAIDACLAAWRDWGEELGPMLRPLFSELHDVHSPASRHWLRTLGILANRIGDVVEALGRPRPPRLLVDALLSGVEFLGYRYHLDSPRDAASWKAARDAMLRLGVGLLGTGVEWSNALAIASALSLDLGGHPPPPPRRRAKQAT